MKVKFAVISTKMVPKDSQWVAQLMETPLSNKYQYTHIKFVARTQILKILTLSFSLLAVLLFKGCQG